MDALQSPEDSENAEIYAAFRGLSELARDADVFLERIAQQLKRLWPESVKVKGKGLFNTGKIMSLSIKRPTIEFMLSRESTIVLAYIGDVSNGVTIARKQVELSTWIKQLVDYLNQEISYNIKARDVLFNLSI